MNIIKKRAAICIEGGVIVRGLIVKTIGFFAILQKCYFVTLIDFKLYLCTVFATKKDV